MSREDFYPSRVEEKPRILRRRDDVAHGAWSPDAPLSEAQTRAFAHDGFLVLRDLFELQEIEVLCADASALRSSRSGSLDPETVIAEPGSGAVRSVFEVHAQSDVFGRLAVDARLADVARFLLDDDVYLHQTRMNYKPGFHGKEFYWHSDFETWHVEDGMPRMRALSMSVLLTENTLHNGPLMLMPGSHRHFVACVGETPDDHYKQSLKQQEYGVPDDESLTFLAQHGGIESPVGRPAPSSCSTATRCTARRATSPRFRAATRSSSTTPCRTRWRRPSGRRGPGRNSLPRAGRLKR